MKSEANRRSETPIVTATTEKESVPLAIVRAIAALENTQPTELPPLNEAVDPDALSAMFEGEETTASMEVSYAEHRVVVTADEIAVY